MALRLIEIYHKRGMAEEIDFLLHDLPILDTWHDHLTENDESVTKILLKSGQDSHLGLDSPAAYFGCNYLYRTTDQIAGTSCYLLIKSLSRPVRSLYP